ncbi:cobalt-zinc-cadmium efflux system protein [Psychrobacter sp. PL15]|jgi:cobalt-zinc-cadmium efflux system protein|uniref:cation diffusion facilitator family transporter n=1 Tax=unclassified Psychrobacter TaxID=196806 RepID=UPI001AE615DD|nr:cation diffusion facilitator family transporter [Psychrobacter sp. PL15]MEC5209441.1 cobalt-zinc-cadmium efflux system protein [Psychrobacter sp. PL15]
MSAKIPDFEQNNSHDSHNHAAAASTAAPNTKGYQRTLLFSFIIITGYMFIEAIGGWLTGSLALLSDAGHMLSDAVALGATLMAFKIGEKAATRQKTFGYKRFEILVASVNGITLVVIALMIFYEAIKRFNSPPDIATQGMLIIATIGMLVNILVAWLMHRSSNDGEGHGHSHGPTTAELSADNVETADHKKSATKKPANLNMQSAYLHVLSDLLGSVAAIIAALLMMGFGWIWADAAASVIVAVLILFSGYRVVRDSVHILMEGTPKGLSLEVIEQSLLDHSQVQKIHDLHVWSITSGLNALSCHVVVDSDMSIHEASLLIAELDQRLQELSISHTTIQVESLTHPHTQTHGDALVCGIAERPMSNNGGHQGHSH